MSRATMVDLPPEEEQADNIEENEVDEIQQIDGCYILLTSKGLPSHSTP